MPARYDKNYHVVLYKFLGFIFPDILKMPHKTNLANTHISLLQTMKTIYKTNYNLAQNNPKAHRL